uniref:hypothetical protein n=1 Tax=uncultured Halomonas sp. TaxID=173971 RepID=UPI00261D8C62|nr:hypothetical protein [uncultured Halomonas sp.]
MTNLRVTHRPMLAVIKAQALMRRRVQLKRKALPHLRKHQKFSQWVAKYLKAPINRMRRIMII